MPTYVYETVPSSPNDSVERFELRQHISDPPLDAHPTSGVPVRRVISGGMGFVAPSDDAGAEPGPGCGPESCHCGRFN